MLHCYIKKLDNISIHREPYFYFRKISRLKYTCRNCIFIETYYLGIEIGLKYIKSET